MKVYYKPHWKEYILRVSQDYLDEFQESMKSKLWIDVELEEDNNRWII